MERTEARKNERETTTRKKDMTKYDKIKDMEREKQKYNRTNEKKKKTREIERNVVTKTARGDTDLLTQREKDRSADVCLQACSCLSAVRERCLWLLSVSAKHESTSWSHLFRISNRQVTNQAWSNLGLTQPDLAKCALCLEV